jgi:hypothetical protein
MRRKHTKIIEEFTLSGKAKKVYNNVSYGGSKLSISTIQVVQTSINDKDGNAIGFRQYVVKKNNYTGKITMIADSQIDFETGIVTINK